MEILQREKGEERFYTPGWDQASGIGYQGSEEANRAHTGHRVPSLAFEAPVL
jgi:hypothetical protein